MSLFEKAFVILALYVDNLIVTSNSPTLLALVRLS